MKKSFMVSPPATTALGAGPSWCALALDKVGPPPLVHEEVHQQGNAAVVSLYLGMMPGMGMG